MQISKLSSYITLPWNIIVRKSTYDYSASEQEHGNAKKNLSGAAEENLDTHTTHNLYQHTEPLAEV